MFFGFRPLLEKKNPSNYFNAQKLFILIFCLENLIPKSQNDTGILKEFFYNYNVHSRGKVVAFTNNNQAKQYFFNSSIYF